MFSKSVPSSRISAITRSFGFLVLVAMGTASAQVERHPVEFPEPASPASGPHRREVIVESEHRFVVKPYSPEIRIQLAEPVDSGAIEDPVDALARFYRSMARGDWEAFRQSWTEKSRAFNDHQNERFGRDAEFWKRVWSRALGAGTSLRVKTRIEMAPYVILDFEIIRANRAPREMVSVVVRENGVWKLTQELATSPVLRGWDRQEKIVRRGVIPWPVQGDRQLEGDLPGSRYPVGEPRTRTLEVDRVYEFEVWDFTPPLRFEPVERAEAHYETPEAALRAHLSARVSRDREWLDETHETETRRRLRALRVSETPSGLDPALAVPTLRLEAAEKVRILRRIQTDSYAIHVVEVTGSPAGDGEEVAPSPVRLAHVVLTPEKKLWKVVRELDADPLLRAWDAGKNRVSIRDLPPAGPRAPARPTEKSGR